ncbi:hypothetical protein ABFO63_10340 [Acinetobacter junii]|uniref:tetratricopeptide repeat protein n=1 Tax=Acinetobacter junii TaxID=40215 RepID=UPI00321431D8
MAALTKSKTGEVIDIFLTPSLKDSSPFGEMAKLKAKYRKDMNSLYENDRNINALFGLAVLADYENNYDLALRYFKKAYVESNKSTLAAINYGSYLGRLDLYEEAIDVLVEAFEKSDDKEHILGVLIKVATEDLAFSKIENIINKYAIKDLEPVKDLIFRHTNIENALEKFEINGDFYREMRSIHKNIFYNYFTLSTPRGILNYDDSSRNSLYLSCGIPKEAFNILFNDSMNENEKRNKMEEVIGNLNDEYQDRIINFMYSDENFGKTKIKSWLQKISFSFCITDKDEEYLGGKNVS